MTYQSIRKRLFRYALHCASACATVLSLFASPHHGIVQFAGLPVPGATVTVSQGDKKLVAVTDQDGAYSFPGLADGIWKIRVEMLCFESLNQDIGVTPDAPSPQWELKLLPMDQIKAAAAPQSALPPPTAATSLSITTPAATANNTPAAQPAATPSITAANDTSKGKKKASAKVKPGAAPTNTQAGFQRTDLNASSDAASASGSSAASPGVNDLSSNQAADALVVGGSASNGIERRTIGNARKGPRSLFNGTALTNVDSYLLDARQYSLTGQHIEKSPYERVRAGFTFGGPLLIPHISHSGQFFVGYQMGRVHNDLSQSGLMPTLAQRSGDFSQAGVTLIDPTTGNPFPGNTIPGNRFSPQALALLKYYPLPNFTPTAAYNYQIPIITRNDTDALQSRVNKTINQKNFVNGAFNYQNSRGVNPNIFGFVDTSNSTGMNANVAWRRSFNQRLNMNTTLTYSRLSTRQTPYFENRENVSGNAGITGNDQSPTNWGPPNLNFLSASALNDGIASRAANQTVGVATAVQWTHRPHNFTFGGEAKRVEFNSIAQNNPRGTFAFTGANTGNDFADFLLGAPATASLAFGNADKYYRSGLYNAYFVDDWRVTSGLTINAGLRWEYGSPITELYGRLVNLDIAPGYATISPVVAKTPTGSLTGQRYPDSLLHPDKHALQPRIGIAWRPFFGSSLVVRVEYTVTYDTSIYQSIADRMAQQSPLSKSFSIFGTATAPLTLANAFNATPVDIPNTFAIDPNYRIGYAQNWRFSIQRDLPGGMIVNVAYTGTKGTRSPQEFFPNTYPQGANNPCPSCPSGYAFLTSNGNATREAGQIQLRRRLHNGITASVQYTFSKSLDDATLGGRASALIAQNWLNLSAERGYSTFDQRHLANIQLQYTSGMGMHGGTLLSGWRGAAFKGWTFLTNITVGSGLPETPIDSALRVSGTGFTGTLRPQYTGALVYDAPAGLALNPAAYATPAPGQYGNAGRNSIVGPSQFSLNGTMQRSFGNFDLTFASTNLLNHVTFPGWITNISSLQFGVPSSANQMRSVLATIRWRF